MCFAFIGSVYFYGSRTGEGSLHTAAYRLKGAIVYFPGTKEISFKRGKLKDSNSVSVTLTVFYLVNGLSSELNNFTTHSFF